LHGVGPIVAGFILGHVGDRARFPTPARFASDNGTPLKPPAGPAAVTGSTHAATARSTTRSTWPRSPRSATTPRPGLLPAQDRRGEVEEGGAARTKASHQRRRLALTRRLLDERVIAARRRRRVVPPRRVVALPRQRSGRPC
jgi:hypothetical protein